MSHFQCSREMEVFFLRALSSSVASGDEREQMYTWKAGVGDKKQA